MKYFEEHLPLVYGYVFGFIGSVAIWEKIAIAALLGFVGAVGGWVFEISKKQVEKYLEKRKKDGKS